MEFIFAILSLISSFVTIYLSVKCEKACLDILELEEKLDDANAELKRAKKGGN